MPVNREDLLGLMELSADAYLAVQPRCRGEEMTFIDDARSGVQCAVRRRGDTLTIAFRGTDSKADWRSNFRFCRKAVPYGNAESPVRVHAGFLAAYKCDAVRGRLHRMMTDSVRRVRVTGHSRGAALAALCALDLQYNFPDRCYEAVLFGCPRVGNAAFARSYDRRVFMTMRVEQGADVVCHVPPALLGYRHVGMRCRVGPRRALPISFLDHLPGRYYMAMFRELPGS